MSCTHETLATNVNTSSHLGAGRGGRTNSVVLNMFYLPTFHNQLHNHSAT